MGKLVFFAGFLTVCFLISESNCLDLLKAKSGQKFSLFQARQALSHLKRKSFIAEKLKSQAKRQDPPPTPPTSVWDALGLERRAFIEEHEDDLTLDVRTAIKEEMDENIEQLRTGMEYVARAISCAIKNAMDAAATPAKRTLNGTETEVEQGISEAEEAEEEEEKELKDLLESFGIDENTDIESIVRGILIPEYVRACSDSPLIMKTGDKEADKWEAFAICSRLLAVKTAEKMEEHDVDTVESFVDRFEEFLRGVLTFVKMFLRVSENPNEAANTARRMLQENNLNELKRFLQDTLKKPQ